jgi:diacylglycerol kinase family enzyme
MKTCVIFNPVAGRSRAQRRLARFRQRYPRAEFWPTEFPEHGVEFARLACEHGYSIIAAAGGDGTVHDVANGILQSNRDDVTLAVVPIGSANDYAYSLARQFGVSTLDDEHGAPVDVGSVTAAGGRESFFVVSLGLGLSARVTLEARQVSRLQGKALYALAVWRAVKAHQSSDFTVQFDGGPPTRTPTLLLSAMLCEREGNFVLAPNARLDDGLFDVVSAAPMGRLRVLGLLPRIALAGVPMNHPKIAHRRCHTLIVQSTTPLAAHTDGEMLCTPADGVHDVTIHLLPARLRVKLCLP